MSNTVNTSDADRTNDVEDRTQTDHSVTEDTTAVPQHSDVVGRQKEAFGGMKFGSCFFGWLTASGTAVLLAALVTGIGTALGFSANVDMANPTPVQTQSIGLVGGIVLLAIIVGSIVIAIFLPLVHLDPGPPADRGQ